MPRTRANKYDAVTTRLAFLSLSESELAEVKAAAILWTLESIGVPDDTLTEIRQNAANQAADATD